MNKVLIIEADPKTRVELAAAMSCGNYSILNASNYEEALSLISSESVSRIILGSEATGADSNRFVQQLGEQTRGRKAMICHLTDSSKTLSCFPQVTSEITQFTISRTSEIHQLREKFHAVDLGACENKEVDKVEHLLDEVFGTLNEYTTEMCDSMRYARQIQKAVLPGEHSLRRVVDAFVMNNPRNIVSGDFFWYTVRFNRIIIAVADCTGHGVPGALLSLIGHDTLNSIVNEKNITEPAQIIKQLNLRFKRVFENNNGDDCSIKDGMDIAVISIDPLARSLDYAGARRPLIGFVNGQQIKIKGDIHSIGVHTPVSTEFQQHRIFFGHDDTFYLASDGYTDQFGGPYNKKIGSRQFEELLCNIHQFPVSVQKNELESFFNNWKKHHTQTDDVLVMGIKPGCLL